MNTGRKHMLSKRMSFAGLKLHQSIQQTTLQ